MSTTPNDSNYGDYPDATWNWARIFRMDSVELSKGEHWDFSIETVFETLEKNGKSLMNGNISYQEFKDNEENLLMQIPLLLHGVTNDKIRDAFQYSLQVTADRFGYNFVNDTFSEGETSMPRISIVEICYDIHDIIVASENESITKLVNKLLRGTKESINACKIAFEFLGF